ncbi:PAS domain S-box protein [Candidatus Methylospira mobilis]|uniref:PAS domain S-box protein n=1 Tax=Candidatus Methylospira mobilis TaxID=1808979 RepID=UPI0028EA6590|nr:PAS domain S-box protein [Candidatus Methylospira mobilis]WNV04537.1 PAS domain S-box protein [Candidatus Methylospira mobilis]
MSAQISCILYIGDDPESLRDITETLETRGHRIAVAPYNEAGLRLALQPQPELILLDTTTAGMDGLASCKQLKTITAAGEIPVIFLTDTYSAVSIDAHFEAGACDCLCKPLQFREAITRIGTHLQLRNAQQQLHAGAQLLQLLIDNHPDFIVRFDTEGRFTYISPRIAASGLPADSILGRTAPEIPLPGCPEQNQALYDAVCKTIATGMPTTLEVQWPKAGGLGKFQVSHYPEFDQHGKVIGVVGNARDTTAQTQNESRAQLLDFALDQVREAAYLIEDGSIIRYVNQEACRALGYSREELLSMTLFDFSPCFNDELSKKIQHDLETAGFTTLEVVHKTKDGRLFPVEINASRFIYEGKQTRFALARDISGRKAAEEKIQRLTDLYAALSQCNQAIMRCANAEELFAQICRDAVLFGKMKMAWIGLIEPDTGRIRPVASYGEGTEYLHDIETSADADNPLGRGPCGVVLREGKPVWCQDFLNDPIAEPWRQCGSCHYWGSSASLPLLQDNILAGVMTVYSGSIDAFDEAARNLLIEMAMDISYALNRFSSETKRIQAEHALQESERRYRDIFEYCSDALFLLEATEDNRFRYIDVNPAFERCRGLPRAQLVGKCIEETLSPELAETLNDKYRSCIASGVPVDEKIGPDLTNGKHRFYHSTAIPVRDSSGRMHRIVGVTRDITADRQAESLETQLRHIAEVLPGLIYSVELTPDGHRRLTYASPRLEDVTGLSRDSWPIDYLPSVHPDDLPGHLDALDVSARMLTPWHNELRIIHPGKGVRWLEGRSIPQEQEDGNILWHGFLYDISERKRAHELLEIREREFRSLAENTPDHITRYDLQLRRTYANPAAQKASWPVRKTMTDDVPRGWIEFQEMLRTVVDNETEADMDMIRIDIGGEERYHHVRFVPEHDAHGAILGVLVIGHDITRRKLMEKALRESEQQFRTLAENAPDIIARYDRECRRIYVNPTLRRSAGLELQQMIGKTPRENTPSSSVWAEYQSRIQAALDEGLESEMELSMADGHGGASHYHMRFVAELGADGRPQGVLAIGRDITSRIRRERQENIRIRIFERLAQGADLVELLRLILEYIEEPNAKLLGSIMLAAPDGKHLHCAFGPKLPTDYLIAINDMPTGDGIGSCGTAAWRGATVITDDLNTHPYWAPYKHLALAAGLQSCWSEPIIDSTGKVMGTFGIYQRRPAFPTQEDLARVRRACHFAAIAIERKRMELALRESEQQFRTLAENSPDIIMRYDLECRRIYVNPAYVYNTGISYDKAIGETPEEHWRIITNMPYKEYLAALRHVMDSGNTGKVMVEWQHPGTGELTSHDVQIVPEHGPDGEINGVFAIGHDISALKRTERQLQESHAMLRDLTRHREAAREEERHRIARELHDELGQLLMALRLNVNLLLMRFGKEDTLFKEATDNLLQLVDNTIQVTRDVSTALRPAVLDMGIVPALEWLTHEFFRQTGITCELNTSPDDFCTQEAQAIALFRIAQETLTNAARHAQASRVQVTLNCTADVCQLQVEDNGVGFDTLLPRKQQSYGLMGLRERAMAVGGELTVSSSAGSGTVVLVRIPTCAGC